MNGQIPRRATIIYGVLLALTALSFWLTVGHGGSAMNESADLVWAQIIVLVGIKIRFVFLEFMELRTAPWALRIGFETLVLAIVVALITVNGTV